MYYMDLIQVIILGIVEGLTEFLPVSSTGHMILAQAFMGIESSEFVKAFTVIIQFGAILSVMVIYWKRFLTSWAFYLKLLVGVIPALALGYLLNDYIDALLGSVWVVASMLLIGGIVMLYIDKWFQARELEKDVTIKNAFIIGLFQYIAMIPGVSRSLATIVGGLQQGLTRKTAAEFSFLLAVPTMFAASSYKVLQMVMSPGGTTVLADNMVALLVGCLISFIVAIFAIKGFVKFVASHTFKVFGYYRIVVGLVVLALLAAGVDLSSL